MTRRQRDESSFSGLGGGGGGNAEGGGGQGVWDPVLGRQNKVSRDVLPILLGGGIWDPVSPGVNPLDLEHRLFSLWRLPFSPVRGRLQMLGPILGKHELLGNEASVCSPYAAAVLFFPKMGPTCYTRSREGTTPRVVASPCTSRACRVSAPAAHGRCHGVVLLLTDLNNTTC